MTNVLAAILGALSITASGAGTSHRDTREVRYHDLDLSTPAGAKALHRRVDRAINAICADQSGPWLGGPIDLDCKADTWASVRGRLDATIAAARTEGVELASADPVPAARGNLFQGDRQ